MIYTTRAYNRRTLLTSESIIMASHQRDSSTSDHLAVPANSPSGPVEHDAMWARGTRSQAIKLALGGYKALKDSRSGVIFLKGGLAISQVSRHRIRAIILA